jgi:hypothetical protein
MHIQEIESSWGRRWGKEAAIKIVLSNVLHVGCCIVFSTVKDFILCISSYGNIPIINSDLKANQTWGNVTFTQQGSRWGL